MKVLTVNNKDYYIYLIEKLKPLTKIQKRFYNELIEKILKNPHASTKDMFYPYKVPSFIINNPDFIKAVQLLRSYSRNSGYSLDIHYDNIMKRSDGSIVITDPYSFFHTSKKVGTKTPF